MTNKQHLWLFWTRTADPWVSPFNDGMKPATAKQANMYPGLYSDHWPTTILVEIYTWTATTIFLWEEQEGIGRNSQSVRSRGKSLGVNPKRLRPDASMWAATVARAFPVADFCPLPARGHSTHLQPAPDRWRYATAGPALSFPISPASCHLSVPACYSLPQRSFITTLNFFIVLRGLLCPCCCLFYALMCKLLRYRKNQKLSNSEQHFLFNTKFH